MKQQEPGYKYMKVKEKKSKGSDSEDSEGSREIDEEEEILQVLEEWLLDDAHPKFNSQIEDLLSAPEKFELFLSFVLSPTLQIVHDGVSPFLNASYLYLFFF